MRAKKDSIFSIFNGPTRDELFDSMKYQYDENARVDITFMFGTSYPVNFDENQGYASSLVKTKNIRIHSITHNDNSGHKFTITGLIDAKIIPVFDYELYSFTIVYSTKEHTGSVWLKKLA